MIAGGVGELYLCDVVIVTLTVLPYWLAWVSTLPILVISSVCLFLGLLLQHTTVTPKLDGW